MYLTIEDLKKGIYQEFLNTITRSEDNTLQAIREAEAEVKSYLCARYDIEAEMQKVGDDRNTMVVKLVRDIAIYNCLNISNPVNMNENRAEMYKQAIAFLKIVQREKASIEGLLRLNKDGSGSNYIKFGGNRKRNNVW